jgi:hypothetical protein
MKSQWDRLDEVARRLAKGDDQTFHVLSTGEKVYAAMAANRADLLERMDYTIAEAIARLGEEWTDALVQRWQYAGNPRKGD